MLEFQAVSVLRTRRGRDICLGRVRLKHAI